MHPLNNSQSSSVITRQPPAPPSIGDLSKKLEISSEEFSNLIKNSIVSEGKASFLTFDQFASRINFFDEKIMMRLRGFNKRISDEERTQYKIYQKQIDQHRAKLLVKFIENLNQRVKEMKHIPVNHDSNTWANTVKSIQDIYMNVQQISKKGGFKDNRKLVESLKKFEQQVAKIMFNKCTLTISQNDHGEKPTMKEVQETLTAQYKAINTLPLSDPAREMLKEEINKHYRKTFNENFKPG